MANSKGSQNIRNLMYSGKHALLPPKIPFPSGSTFYTDYVPSSSIGSKAVQKPRDGKTHHHRTSSESFLIEEQPSWFDDLLNEPETPVHKGHKRASSDSFAYVDTANAYNIDTFQDMYGYGNVLSGPFRGSHDFDYHKDARHLSSYLEANLMKQKIRGSESLSNSGVILNDFPSARENSAFQSLGSSSGRQETEGVSCTAGDKKDPAEQVSNNPTKESSENMDNPHAKLAVSETNTKRARQQFAQRSRVRKLQYIAELERNVQALQAEGSEVSAELEFLNQQTLILNMENKALKQRLESLTQEQLIKYLEHEVLEKEITRLKALYQRQQQQPQEQQQLQTKKASTGHRRSKSRDLDSQFSNLSLKP